jgi:hypothetical protein
MIFLDDLDEINKKLKKLYSEIPVNYRINNSELFDYYNKIISE